ncbi:MAG: HIT family protein [Gammaproteobacteria bacterium]|nr:HIT family protein [Gammaproteobacteria bacterium]
MKNSLNTHPFKLDSRLESDCEWVVDLALCRLLLMNNASVPWLILVPKIQGATELTHLPIDQQHQVLKEINKVAAIVTKRYNPHKLNIGALGNLVSQLHIHVIGRFTHDPAWPNPVWGQLSPNTYDREQLASELANLRVLLSK